MKINSILHTFGGELNIHLYCMQANQNSLIKKYALHGHLSHLKIVQVISDHLLFEQN